jgi:hypothetical protein
MTGFGIQMACSVQLMIGSILFWHSEPAAYRFLIGQDGLQRVLRFLLA